MAQFAFNATGISDFNAVRLVVLFALPLGGMLYFRGTLPKQDYLYFMIMSIVFLSGLLNLAGRAVSLSGKKGFGDLSESFFYRFRPFQSALR